MNSLSCTFLLLFLGHRTTRIEIKFTDFAKVNNDDGDDDNSDDRFSFP